MLMLFVVVFRKKPRFVPSYCCHFLIFLALWEELSFMFLFLYQDWQPPFACDVRNFRFTPRVQRLNELEVSLSRRCISPSYQ